MKIQYNQKIDYLIAKFTYRKYLGAVDEKEWRAVYHEKIPPKTQSQEFMLRIKKALSFIKSENCQFNFSSIMTIYKIVLKEQHAIFHQKKLENYIQNIQRMNKNQIFQAYIQIVQLQLFAKYNCEMAILLFNLLKIKSNQIPIVFYPKDVKEINQALYKEYPEELIIALIVQNAHKTMEQNKWHPLIPKDEIIEHLFQLRPKLYEQFGVTGIGIYGSYARGEENEYSDLDIFINVIDVKKEDIYNKKKIFVFLTEKLGLNVDGKCDDIEFKFGQLRVDMQRDLIKIY